MSGPSARRPLWAGLAVLALALTAVVVYVGTRGDSPGATSAPAASPSPTVPLDEVDLRGLRVDRTSLCDSIDDDDVEDALGAAVARTAHYDSGDRATLAPGVRDVSHEFDCTYLALDGTQARVWVFAEPVTRYVARRLVVEGRRAKGCRPLRAAPTFGDPDLATVCRARNGTSVTLSGLFGDAWLSCQLRSAAAESDRGKRLCVRVVQGADS